MTLTEARPIAAAINGQAQELLAEGVSDAVLLDRRP